MNQLLIAIGAGIAAIGIFSEPKKEVDTPAKIVPNTTDEPKAGLTPSDPESIKLQDEKP